MFWLMFTVLLSLGVVGILDSSTRVSEFLQFLVICAVVALGIHSNRRSLEAMVLSVPKRRNK